MKKIGILAIILFMGCYLTKAQTVTLTNAIKIAQENSLDAQIARFSFMSKYWQYRSFQAQLKPSVNLGGMLGNYNHSLSQIPDPETGLVNYIGSTTLTNDLTLSLDQKIVATGGTISLRSSLERQDQFKNKFNNLTNTVSIFKAQPFHITYSQDLRAFNSLKWEKKTAPMEYQVAERTYISALQDVTITVTSLFFNVLSAQSNYKQSLATVEDRERLYEMAKTRLELTTTTKSDVLQLELSLLNARMSVKNNKIALDDAMYDLFSYLRVSDYADAELIPPYSVPDLLVNADDVLQKAIKNSTHGLDQQLQLLEAQKILAQAKANKGIQMSLSSTLGFENKGFSVSESYRDLMDNEIIGLTLSLPIFDWGVSKGKVKMAQAQLDVVKTQLEQSHLDFMQNLRKKVTQFNAQPSQCRDALRAQEIAVERYEITRKRYEAGAISVTELNTAQQEMESAKAQYISQLSSFWNDYYTLQKSTLYDWQSKCDLTVDFESLIK